LKIFRKAQFKFKMTDLSCTDYTDKSCVVRGDTKTYKDDLLKLGGKYNANLRDGPGWIFSKKSEDKILAYIASGKLDGEKSSSAGPAADLSAIEKAFKSMVLKDRLSFVAAVAKLAATMDERKPSDDDEPKPKSKAVAKPPAPARKSPQDEDSDDEDEPETKKGKTPAKKPSPQNEEDSDDEPPAKPTKVMAKPAAKKQQPPADDSEDEDEPVAKPAKAVAKPVKPAAKPSKQVAAVDSDVDSDDERPPMKRLLHK